MSTQQPKALRFAENVENHYMGLGRIDAALAASELRQLHSVNADLLEALKAFLRAPSVGSSGPGSSTIVVQDFNLRAARAAIAKATGGAA
jgi:hypothetical protein